MSPRARTVALLAVLTLVAFALRIAAARGMAYWDDDVGTLVEAARLSWGNLLTASPSEAHPPLSFLLAKGWLALTGLRGAPGEELLVRLPFLAIGSLAVPLAFLVARRLLAREAWAFAVAAFTAVSPLLLWCDRDIRAYALFTPIALATVHAWLVAVDECRPRSWPRFVGLAALALWTHYNAIPLVGTLLLVALLERGRAGVRRPLIAGACILLLYAAWLPAFWTHFTVVDLEAHRAKVQLSIPPVALTAPAYVLFGLVLGHSVFPWNAAVVAPVVVASATISAFALARAREETCWRAPLFGLALPLAGAVATTFKMPRYYVAYVPLLAVFLASGIERVESRSRRVALALGGIVLAGALASDVELFRGREYHFLYPLHPWATVRRIVDADDAPVFGRAGPLARYVGDARARPPEEIARATGRAAWLLVDEGTSEADEAKMVAVATSVGWHVVSDEPLLVDPDHEARERWIPRGKRATPVRLLRLAR